MRKYSSDLRQRIVNAYLAGEGSQYEIAKRFAVSVSTVKNYLRIYKQTGELLPKEHGGGRSPAVSNQRLPLLEVLLQGKSDMTLDELRESFTEKTGIKVSKTSMWRAVNKLNWTYKKRLYMHRREIEKMSEKSERYF